MLGMEKVKKWGWEFYAAAPNVIRPRGSRSGKQSNKKSILSKGKRKALPSIYLLLLPGMK